MGKEAQRQQTNVDNSPSQTACLVGTSFKRSDSGNVDTVALMRKLHWRVLPMSLLILIFANIDRGNLGFVANQLCGDLNLTQTEYGTGASVFFVGFLVSRIPSNLALRHFGAPFWLMTIMFCWGIIAASMSIITNDTQFYILRFLLGIAEGGAFPGVWYYLTEFYPDEYLTFPYTVTAAAAPIATALSGPIAAIFVSLDGLYGIASWRYLFFFEGLLPTILTPMMYFLLPKSVESATFLTSDEQIWIQQRQTTANRHEQRSFIGELKMFFKCMHFWLMNVSGIVHMVLFSVVMYWTTLMIEDVFTSEEAKDEETCASSHSTGLFSIVLTSFVFILSSFTTFILGILSEKRTDRNILAGCATALCGLALASWTLAEYYYPDLGLVSLSVAACAMNAPTGLIVGLLVSRYDSNAKATALSLYATVASLGALIGPMITGTLVDHYGNYNIASVVLGAIGVAGGVLLVFAVKDPLADVADKEHDPKDDSSDSVPQCV